MKTPYELLSPNEIQRLPAVEIAETQFDRPVSVIGTFTGVSCYKNALGDKIPTKEVALDNLKALALKSVANGVQNVRCHFNEKVDWQTNCWKEFICTGEAVKFEAR